jgi:branched-chain amino acid transport system ATP-binding protein
MIATVPVERAVISPGTDAVVLEVKTLQAEYRDIPVLWDVSLTVRRGEIVALLGANGAGKTTLMRAVSGLREGFLDITHGEIRFLNRPITGLDAARIVGLGLVHVPEGRHIFPGLSTLENLHLAGWVRLSRAERREALERVFGLLPVLADRRRQLAGTLSGGQQQMLAIGRALMQRPTVLMLDEPSHGLAPRIVALLFELIARIRADGITVMLAEQDVHRALALADRGYVLENGRITVEGAAPELLDHPKVRRAFLGL